MCFEKKGQKHILLVIVLMLSLAIIVTGCGGNAQEEPQSPQGTDGEDANKGWEPTETVEFVVHNSPGSGADYFARSIAHALTNNNIVNQRIVVNNREGGGGIVSREYVHNQAGNPHILTVMTETHLVRGMSNPDDFPPTMFTPIALLIGDPTVVIVPANSPYQTMDDILEDARNRPGQVTQGSGAVGAGEWILARLIEREADVEFNFISFRTGGESITAILGGHVDFGLANPVQVNEHVEAGNLRYIAVGTDERLPSIPDVPTLKELGIDAVNFGLRGFWAPPDISAEAEEFWINAMKEVMQTEEVKNMIKQNMMVDAFISGQEYADYMQDFYDDRLELFRAAGMVD